jgi:predicted Na+-dependent transporter
MASPPPPLLTPLVVEEPASWSAIVSNTLLFLLVFGLAASVDTSLLKHREWQLVRGCCTALSMQFLALPFIGFCSSRLFQLDHMLGVMLQVVMSCPGGAYSNWWCSLFNADLALSVVATALSTVLSAGLLPLNLYLYLQASYGPTLLQTLRWDMLLISVAVVTSAVLLGLAVAAYYVGPAMPLSVKLLRRRRVTVLGNVSGACLIIFSLVYSNSDEPLWNKTGQFYGSISLPCLAAMVLAHLVSSLPCLRLSPPERMAVTIECLYQNVGIALSVALSVFSTSNGQASKAAAVPLFYGFCQLLIIPIYVIIGWKLGWSYAPPSDPVWRVLRDSYQHNAAERGRVGGGDGRSRGGHLGEELREMDVEPENDSDLSNAAFTPSAQPSPPERTV